MQTTNVVAVTAEREFAREPLSVQKRRGSTTYVVSVHFCKTAKETLEQKLLRLIEQDQTVWCEVQNAS